ncbi:MAG: DUF6174 domain-containing protein [Gemmatimonadota bacterium]|nr:DUF6174 domain-containing protein [Gemmatimonadota bacterium]
MTVPHRHLALLAAMLACGCSTTTPTPTEQERLEAAVLLWEAQELRSYHYEFRFVCGECPPGWEHLRRIVVDKGVITQVADLISSEEVEIDERSATIEKLFRDIRDTLAANPWQITVTYHPTQGYPTSLFVDLREAVQDDEFGYLAQNMTALPVR